jgi:hypothetical protein
LSYVYNFIGCFLIIFNFFFFYKNKGPTREPYTSLINFFIETPQDIFSVDIPSGWHVNEGDIFKTLFTPQAVISLTLPKLCMKNFGGTHYVGGRFIRDMIFNLLLLLLFIIVIIIGIVIYYCL